MLGSQAFWALRFKSSLGNFKGFVTKTLIILPVPWFTTNTHTPGFLIHGWHAQIGHAIFKYMGFLNTWLAFPKLEWDV